MFVPSFLINSLFTIDYRVFSCKYTTKTAEMQEKLQKNYNHRHQKALSRCDLNPFSEVSVTKTGSQHIDRQAFRKQGDSDRRFATFYFSDYWYVH